ncbi:MAG: hypothetical protein HY707_11780 [Ignavibacteriae bacterium]|nr:hypothetical protein [Ignavibacteriota bacterium]
MDCTPWMGEETEAVQKVIITVIASEAKQSQPLNFLRNVRLLRHFVTRNDAFGDFLDSLTKEGVSNSARKYKPIYLKPHYRT